KQVEYLNILEESIEDQLEKKNIFDHLIMIMNFKLPKKIAFVFKNQLLGRIIQGLRNQELFDQSKQILTVLTQELNYQDWQK
ncbi:hypothetical protein BpHYR1_003196, partial [Brachionus plicatilis]